MHICAHMAVLGNEETFVSDIHVECNNTPSSKVRTNITALDEVI